MQVSPDKKSVVSGGADKTIRFWNFKIDVNGKGGGMHSVIDGIAWMTLS